MANYEPDAGALTPDQIKQIKKLNMNDLKFTTAGNYMPTRLEDLMYRSGLTASGCWDQLDAYDRKAIERFGELIVDDICNDMLSLEPMYPANIVALKIRQRYGVGADKNLGALDQYDDPAWQGKQ